MGDGGSYLEAIPFANYSPSQLFGELAKDTPIRLFAKLRWRGDLAKEIKVTYSLHSFDMGGKGHSTHR